MTPRDKEFLELVKRDPEAIALLRKLAEDKIENTYPDADHAVQALMDRLD